MDFENKQEMAKWLEREQWIKDNLRPEKIIHGNLFVTRIYYDKSTVNPAKVSLIKDSLERHGYNVLSLAVRPSTEFGSEIDYELIYGVDWCHAAHELGMENLWVRVYDVDKLQAEMIAVEMQLLLGSDDVTDLPQLVALEINSLRQDIKSELNSLKAELNLKEKFDHLQSELNTIKEKLSSGGDLSSHGKPLPPCPVNQVNINDPKLTLKMLKNLGIKGLGEKTFKEITQLRQEQGGSFQSLEDLVQVKRISLEMMKDWKNRGILVCEPAA